jgi:hypothetical protein
MKPRIGISTNEGSLTHFQVRLKSINNNFSLSCMVLIGDMDISIILGLQGRKSDYIRFCQGYPS